MANPVEQYNRVQTRMVHARDRIMAYSNRKAALKVKLDALNEEHSADLAQVKADAILIRTKLDVPSGDITATAVLDFVNSWKPSPEADKTAALTDKLVKYAETLP